MFSASLVVFALNVLYPSLGSEISDFSDWKKDALLMDRPMDGPTDRRMDRPSYRDARMHPKTHLLSGCVYSEFVKSGINCNHL